MDLHTNLCLRGTLCETAIRPSQNKTAISNQDMHGQGFEFAKNVLGKLADYLQSFAEAWAKYRAKLHRICLLL